MIEDQVNHSYDSGVLSVYECEVFYCEEKMLTDFDDLRSVSSTPQSRKRGGYLFFLLCTCGLIVFLFLLNKSICYYLNIGLMISSLAFTSPFLLIICIPLKK